MLPKRSAQPNDSPPSMVTDCIATTGAVPYHPRELPGVVPVRVDCGIGSVGDARAQLQHAPEDFHFHLTGHTG